MQLLESVSRAPASDEAVNAYIGAVMHELYYPIFLRKKLRSEIREFLCREFDFDEAIAVIGDDALEYQIGEPRTIAESFAEKYKYVCLRGPMPTWKKRLIAAFFIFLVVITLLFAFHVYTDWDYTRGFWGEESVGVVSVFND